MKILRTSLPQTLCHGHFGNLSGDICISYRMWLGSRVKDMQKESPGTESSPVPEAVVTSTGVESILGGSFCTEDMHSWRRMQAYATTRVF